MLQQPLLVMGTSDATGTWLASFLGPTAPALSTEPANYTTLRMPVLIVWGESDTVTPLAQGKYLKSLLKNATLVSLPGVNHVPHVEDQLRFNAVLLEFLAKASNPSP